MQLVQPWTDTVHLLSMGAAEAAGSWLHNGLWGEPRAREAPTPVLLEKVEEAPIAVGAAEELSSHTLRFLINAVPAHQRWVGWQPDSEVRRCHRTSSAPRGSVLVTLISLVTSGCYTGFSISTNWTCITQDEPGTNVQVKSIILRRKIRFSWADTSMK